MALALLCLAPLRSQGQGSPVDEGFVMAVTDSFPRAAAFSSDGKIYIGGSFTNVNGVPRHQMARLHSDGALDASFDLGSGTWARRPNFPVPNSPVVIPGSTNMGSVAAIAVQPDGKILVGGGFTEINGTSRTNIARLLPDGTVDATFEVPGGLGNGVNTIRLLADGKMLVGGGFTQYGGTNLPGLSLIRLKANGVLDETFNLVSGYSGGSFFDLAPDGKIVAAALDFSDGVSAKIIRLTPNGSLDRGFATGAGAPAPAGIGRVAVQPDGKIIAAGMLRGGYNGSPVRNVFRLNANGSLDAAFQPEGIGEDIASGGMALDGEGRVFVAGILANNKRMICLTDAGNTDAGFELPPQYEVHALWMAGEGSILASGLRIGPGHSRGVFRLLGNAPATALPVILLQPQSQTVPAGAEVVLRVEAAGPKMTGYQWLLNGDPIAGATNAFYSLMARPDKGEQVYRVLVSNAAGAVTSAEAVVKVLPPPEAPVILTQPQDVTAALGGAFTLTVEASGVPAPVFEWRRNGELLRGTTGPSLAVTNAQKADFGRYAVLVKNPAGSVLSREALVAESAASDGPRLFFERTGPGILQLEVPPGMVLQSASSLTSSNWMLVPAPHRIPMEGPARFYRLMQP